MRGVASGHDKRLRKGSPTRSSDAMSGYLQALADELRAVHQDRATATQAVARSCRLWAARFSPTPLLMIEEENQTPVVHFHVPRGFDVGPENRIADAAIPS